MSPALFEQKVNASLDQSVVAFNAGRPEFFDDFADDATIFTADSAEPIKGREAYRQKFESALTSQQHEKKVLDRQIQIVGNRAVVTQTAEITRSGVSANVRQTIVYGDTDAGLKVVHLHNALLAPKANDGSIGMAPIRVVNERIATISGQFGVAQ